MSKRAFDKIAAALSDAVAFAKGDTAGAVVIHRRAILGAFAVIPAAALLGCESTTPVTPASVVSDAQTTVSALQTTLKQLAVAEPNLIPADDMTRITADLATAATAAAQLNAGLPATTGASTAKIVEGDINDVLDVLAGPPVNGLIPAPANQIIAAAAIVAPALEAFIAQYVPAAAASPVVTTARVKLAAAAPMTLTQARAILAKAAGVK